MPSLFKGETDDTRKSGAESFADMKQAIDSIGFDHKTGALHIRNHIMENVRSVRKLHKRKLAQASTRMSAKLKEAELARRNVALQIRAHEDADARLMAVGQLPAQSATAATPTTATTTAAALATRSVLDGLSVGKDHRTWGRD